MFEDNFILKENNFSPVLGDGYAFNESPGVLKMDCADPKMDT